jgi:hypothetical protein
MANLRLERMLPFLVPTTASGDAEIDLEAFRRAFALLVMRGFELFGAKQDGLPLSRKVEMSYPEKVPRLSRIIFRCLSQSSPESAPQTKAAQEVRQWRDIKDTIEYTQPVTSDLYPYGPKVDNEQFQVTASRLARIEDDRSAIRSLSQILLKTDLGRLIQLLLLLGPQDRRWRDGYSCTMHINALGTFNALSWLPAQKKHPDCLILHQPS